MNKRISGIIFIIFVNICFLGNIVFEIYTRKINIFRKDPMRLIAPPGSYSLESYPNIYYPVIYCQSVGLLILCFLLFVIFREKK
jgi:uncharacterized protein with PQ loop repeat